jgi:hypothetical protein
MIRTLISESALAEYMGFAEGLSRDALVMIAGAALHAAAKIPDEGDESLPSERREAKQESRLGELGFAACVAAVLCREVGGQFWRDAFEQQFTIGVGHDGDGIPFVAAVEGVSDLGRTVLAKAFADVRAERIREAKELLAVQ